MTKNQNVCSHASVIWVGNQGKFSPLGTTFLPFWIEQILKNIEGG